MVQFKQSKIVYWTSDDGVKHRKECWNQEDFQTARERAQQEGARPRIRLGRQAQVLSGGSAKSPRASCYRRPVSCR